MESGLTLKTILVRQIIRNRYETQTACAHAWGVTRSYVSAICRGRRPVPWWARGDLGL